MNIQQLKGIGEKTAALLSRLSVYTVKDLVGLYPRAYDVYEKPVFVQEAVEEHASEIVSIEAVVARNVEQYSTPRMKVLSTVVRDEQGTSLKCTWFNMPFLRSSLNGYFSLMILFRPRLNFVIILFQPFRLTMMLQTKQCFFDRERK